MSATTNPRSDRWSVCLFSLKPRTIPTRREKPSPADQNHPPRRRRRHRRRKQFVSPVGVRPVVRSMDRRPPLAVSPRRLRPRQHRAAAAGAAPRPPVACSVQTPPGSIKKATTPMRSSFCALPTSRLEPTPRAKLDFAAAPSPARAAVAAGKENRHVDDEVSLDLTAMAMPTPMPTWTASPLPPPTSPLFERGRLYDLYSARRNERLKRKHGFPAGEEEAEAMAADPCVAVELSKRRGAKKMTGAESVRRSMPAAADFSAAGRAATSTLGLRSSLRSSKEMKKTSAASSSFAGSKSPAAKERRASTRSSARRF
uniref:Uncharacterized protein n=1 Tax=Oryza rufipogon TaxID=4529 RepID=A0A0E0Q827_ORYRU